MKTNDPSPAMQHKAPAEAVAATGEYKYGFTTDIDTDILPPGLSEDTIRYISAQKQEPEWLLNFRLKADRKSVV